MILRIGKPARLKNKGFTLIELILASIVILILVGLATPLFRRPFSSIQLKNTSQNLVQLMRYGQARAVAERKICRMNFDFEKGIFWLTAQGDIQPGEFERIKGRWGKTFHLPEAISIDSETNFIAFYPDGSSDKAEIKISNKKKETFTIGTQNRIGYVKIKE